jgi:hypothetical protein
MTNLVPVIAASAVSVVGAVLCCCGFWLYRQREQIVDAHAVARSLAEPSTVQVVNKSGAKVEARNDGAGVRIVIS